MNNHSSASQPPSNLQNAGASSDDGLAILHPVPITLEDHTVNPSENSSGLWARRAEVVDYAIVSGSRTRAGAYVAWNCHVETFEVCARPAGINQQSPRADGMDLSGRPVYRSKAVCSRISSACIRHSVLICTYVCSYSEFFLLHEQLKKTFPKFAKYLPDLPPKSVICMLPWKLG
jgi:hypothetical protein